MPSVRRKYSVTVCPILPENVTRNVDDVVTVEHGPLTLNETQTLVAYVPSGFFTVPVKLIACGVAVVVGFGVGVSVGVAGGAVVGRDPQVSERKADGCSSRRRARGRLAAS